MCKQRGYSIAELNNVLYRPLDANEHFPPLPASCTIRRGSPEEARELGSIVERAFFPEGAPGAFQDLLTPLYQMEGAVTFAAVIPSEPQNKVESKIVACGAGLIIPEHRVFAICGAGTMAEYRGRGLQTALLQARLQTAAKAGCEYAAVVTQGGTASQRNCERLGFRVAYSKVTVIKEFGS
jgi:GNAT superfamily N-acetyltransferase